MLHWIWSGMVGFSVIFAAFRGFSGHLFPAAIAAAEGAVSLALRLAAGYGFFCGMIEILKELGAARALARVLRPVLSRLLPALREAETIEAVCMNFTANLLGLGNAATPLGLRAMEGMAKEMKNNPRVSDSICMFLVVNATSLQLLPTTVLALRASAGSVSPGAVLLPTLACTALSTAVGIAAARLCARRSRD